LTGFTFGTPIKTTVPPFLKCNKI